MAVKSCVHYMILYFSLRKLALKRVVLFSPQLLLANIPIQLFSPTQLIISFKLITQLIHNSYFSLSLITAATTTVFFSGFFFSFSILLLLLSPTTFLSPPPPSQAKWLSLVVMGLGFRVALIIND